MDSSLLALVAAIAFLVLLLTGRAQVAKGANTATANGATLLTLAVVAGALALALVASLDIW